MKSFNQHVDKKSENLQEDPFDDLTDLLWVGAAGAGIWGLSKGWDKFGKDAVASLPFAPDKWKAAKVDRKKEKRETKQLKLLDNLEHLVRHNAQERSALGKDEPMAPPLALK